MPIPRTISDCKSPHFSVLLCGVLIVAGLSCVTDIVSARHFGAAVESVVLIVDYGDGVQKQFNAVPWRDKMSVEDVMKFASEHPRGVKISMRGKGPTAFLYKIDDLENQGGRGMNWIFRVNNTLGDRSFAVHRLKPGDTVLWRFGKYE